MRNYYNKLGALGIVLLLSTGARAQNAPVADADLQAKLAAVEKRIDAKREELKIPGAALVIVQDDHVIYMKGLGLRDVARQLPVTPQTLFAIGSSSKAFTAMTVMMSADAGKLALTDPPRKFLPYFKLRDPEADGKITIGDLLCHRSGLARTDLAWATGRLKPAEVIRVAGMAQPTAKLGAQFQYQNVMFLTAGEIVGHVWNSSWPRVVADRIFTPLHMRSTNTSIRRMQQADDYAIGYAPGGGANGPIALPMRDLACIAPAGAINSNVRDKAQWLRLMLGEGVYEGRRLVSEQSYAELFKRRIVIGGPVGYGYGWFLRTWNGHPVMEHGGNIDGFNAQVALMPDRKLGLVLLTNVSASPLGSVAMDAVWENLVGPATKPEAPVATAAGPRVDPALEAGRYLFVPANLAMEVKLAEGKLALSVPGQPDYPLENLGGRRYRLGSPAPAGFFATFRPSKADPNVVEMFLEQPQGNLVLTRSQPTAFKAPIGTDELMGKMVEALGGEAALRQIRTLTLRYTLDMEREGVVGEETIRHRAPNALTDVAILRACGKKIATIREYYDGTQGGTEISFAQAGSKTGAALDDAAVEAAFPPYVDWKRLYKSVAIKAVAKVEGQEAYAVEFTPTKGTAYTVHVSTTSFLPIKVEGPGPQSETLSDYRTVRGMKLPYTRIRSAADSGRTILTLREARVNAESPLSTFGPTWVRPPLPERAADFYREAMLR